MKLLLDTHIWLWALLQPKRLPTKIARALASPRSELWLSPISLWEAQVLIEHGHVRTKNTTPHAWVAEALRKFPVNDARLTMDVALHSRTVGLAHQDPADRFIAATAVSYELVLATIDERLVSGTGFRTLST